MKVNGMPSNNSAGTMPTTMNGRQNTMVSTCFQLLKSRSMMTRMNTNASGKRLKMELAASPELQPSPCHFNE